MDTLLHVGVRTFYGIPGGAISPIYDALCDRPDAEVVHTRHETSALFMCIGRAKACTGDVACVLVTSGPGVTNAVTGLAAALAEGVPVVVIGGEVPLSKFGQGALQEGSQDSLDVLAIVRSVTRYAARISTPDQAAFEIAAAIEIAREQRGPVFLSLPLDVAVAPARLRVPAPVPRRARATAHDVLAHAADALARAQRPLVLAGAGALGAASELRRLVDRLDLPVITSPKAKGVVAERAPYCLGVFGYGGHPSATSWLEQERPDVTLALGCGFSEPSTNSWSPLLQPREMLIQIDLDPRRFGRHYVPDIAIAMDCAEALRELDPLLATARPRPRGHEGVRYYDPETREIDGTPLAHARVLSILQAELPADTIFTVDIGEHLLFALHYLCLDHPDQLIVSYGLGSMGSGIASAVGAKLARPERTVVSLCGDFGFQMYGMELNTCVQEGAGPVFVVLNDQRMRMVEAGIARNYGRGLAMDGPLVDFAQLARAHGVDGLVVRTANELREALRGRRDPRPLVLDVRVAPDARFPVNMREKEISNFTAEVRDR